MVRLADMQERVNTPFDLPAYIESRYPGAVLGYVPGRRQYKLLCKWRGEKNPSGTLSQKPDGTWLWYDHAECKGGSGLDFMLEIEGMSEREAWERYAPPRHGDRKYRSQYTTAENKYTSQYSTHCSGSKKTVNTQVNTQETKEVVMLAQEHIQTLKRAQQTLVDSNRLPQTWFKRGLSTSDAIRYGIGRIEEDTLIPILNHEGELVHIKRRFNRDKDEGPRYQYLQSGLGAPAWWNSEYANPAAEFAVILEGEGKAMSLDNAFYHFRKHTEKSTCPVIVGIPGASAKLPIEELKALGKPVVIIPDIGEAASKAVHGTKERLGWEAELRNAGIEVYVTHPLADVCDLAHAHVKTYGHREGNAKLAEEVLKLIESAKLGHETRIMARRLSKTVITPELLKQWGNRADTLAKALMFMLRRLANGEFIIPKAFNMDVIEELSLMPMMRFSYTKATQAVGARHRPQGIRAVRYAQEALGLIPMPRGFFPKVTTTYGMQDINIYMLPIASLVNSPSSDPVCGGNYGFFTVRDATRATNELAAPLTVRAQIALQVVRRHGSMSIARLKQIMRVHGNSLNRILKRLELHGLVKVVDGIVALAEGWYESFTAYFKHVEEVMKGYFETLWESVRWDRKPKRWWFRKPREYYVAA